MAHFPAQLYTVLAHCPLISYIMLINFSDAGTKLRYKPGVLAGGHGLVHSCGTSRAIGYFLEPLIILGLFGKSPLSITLKGID